MKRARRQNRRYRGSRSGGIGVLIPVLIVLCVIAAGILYFVNDNMTFTLDGTFLSPDKEKTSGDDVSANLIIESPEDAPPVQPDESTVEPKDETAVPENDAGVRALFIPIGEVKSEELFAAKLSEISADKRINTLVLEVKAEDGTLAFSSDSPLASAAAVSGDDGTLSRVMQSAKEKGIAFFFICRASRTTKRRAKARRKARAPETRLYGSTTEMSGGCRHIPKRRANILFLR